MSLSLKQDENIIAECKLQEFSATLTNFRLHIISPVSEENFPLRGITGIGIYDNVDKYQKDYQRQRRRHKSRQQE